MKPSSLLVCPFFCYMRRTLLPFCSSSCDMKPILPAILSSILLYEADLAAILPLLLLSETDFTATSHLKPSYESNYYPFSCCMNPILLPFCPLPSTIRTPACSSPCYEADTAAILLLAASIDSEIPGRGLAEYRSAAINTESKPQGASAGIAKRNQLALRMMRHWGWHPSCVLRLQPKINRLTNLLSMKTCCGSFRNKRCSL